ncbi:MAG: hypothetical protein DSY43_02455 [Gammaproteobacteria bacterium]|nr:MAG: hypothetical protein DSY43_02455 [Gammaproteobacteria bacterium]
MFTNTITANISFDYQGQHYSLKSTLDIDHIIHHDNFYQSVYLSVAKSNNIDLHSYQLEVMMDQSIVFTNEKGCVQGCVTDGILDLKLLREAHQKVECLPAIEPLIKKFEVDNDIHSALVEAYLLGKKSK